MARGSSAYKGFKGSKATLKKYNKARKKASGRSSARKSTPKLEAAPF